MFDLAKRDKIIALRPAEMITTASSLACRYSGPPPQPHSSAPRPFWLSLPQIHPCTRKAAVHYSDTRPSRRRPRRGTPSSHKRRLTRPRRPHHGIRLSRPPEITPPHPNLVSPFRPPNPSPFQPATPTRPPDPESGLASRERMGQASVSSSRETGGLCSPGVFVPWRGVSSVFLGRLVRVRSYGGGCTEVLRVSRAVYSHVNRRDSLHRGLQSPWPSTAPPDSIPPTEHASGRERCHAPFISPRGTRPHNPPRCHTRPPNGPHARRTRRTETATRRRLAAWA